MKLKNTLLALAAMLPAVTFANAADEPAATTAAPAPAKTDAFETIEQNGQKYIHISTISQVSACEEFMKNVQILGAQRQALVELDRILSPEEKELLKDSIKNRTEAFAKNNEAMTKAYGFNITRDYVQQIVSTKIFLKLSDEEYKKAREEAENKKDGEKPVFEVKGDDKYQLVATIPTAEENDLFRRNVQIMQNGRERLIQMNNVIAQMEDGEEKTKLEEQFKNEEETLKKNNDEMIKHYGFSLTRNYMMQVEKIKLFMKVNEEEYLKAEAQARLEAAEKSEKTDAESQI
ncbi:MAG: hypothetical protein K6B46_06770 [Opitutales bacterium]|nr:hypothetical protein [Opitutales bacterium]